MTSNRIRLIIYVALIATLGGSARALCETTEFPVARDLWVSSAGGEEHGNNGGAPRLKLKGYQEFSLLDFDLDSLRGKKIKSARLLVTLAGEERLYRTAVGTISEEWTEGTGANYERQDGSSSFAMRAEPDVPWFTASEFLNARGEYSDLTSVIFSEGGSIWSHADVAKPSDGRQMIEVAPEIVTSRLYGFSYGFVLFDDQGTELKRDGDNVEIRLFPNRFLYSREQNKATQPYLYVEYEDPSERELAIPVESPTNLVFDARDLPAGSVSIEWRQEHCDSRGILGFEASVDGRVVPLTLTPRPALGASRRQNTDVQSFRMRLDRLDPSVKHKVELVAVDSLGRKSEPSAIMVTASERVFEDWAHIVGSNADVAPQGASGDKSMLPQFGGSQVAIVNEFIKFTEDGKTIPETNENEFVKNAVWNAKEKRIELTTARNEFVGFQIAFLGKTPKARFEMSWENGDAEKEKNVAWSKKSIPATAFYRYAKVASPKGQVADPMLECDFSGKSTEESDVYYCEIFTPAKASSGMKVGALTITNDDGDRLTLEVRLQVWNFQLPNELRFLPEMNCYGLPENELDYYRLAQLHRVYVNRVPYSHRGTVGDGLAPRWDARSREFDWSDWRERFERYFTGEAFADLPRGAVPIEAFYLPLFENFPADVFTGLDESVWPSASAFSKEYRATFSRGVELFANEIAAQKWSKTRFLFFLNNKSDYKRNGWSNASSPWLLDEPASYRDFAALQYFGRAVKNVVRKKDSAGYRSILYRADISRPQWERDSLDALLDLYVVPNDVNKRYRRMIAERCERDKRIVFTYGETAPPHESAYQPVLWQLDAWSSGAEGVVPWQTIGNSDSWRESDPLAILYPPSDASGGKVAPSLRLKAYRRGEQDVEYLVLLQRVTKRPRAELETALRERLALDASSARRASSEDAGTTRYNGSSPDDLERMRREAGTYLDRASKALERK